jgi:hypothetical protein
MTIVIEKTSNVHTVSPTSGVINQVVDSSPPGAGDSDADNKVANTAEISFA